MKVGNLLWLVYIKSIIRMMNTLLAVILILYYLFHLGFKINYTIVISSKNLPTIFEENK